MLSEINYKTGSLKLVATSSGGYVWRAHHIAGMWTHFSTLSQAARYIRACHARYPYPSAGQQPLGEQTAVFEGADLFEGRV